MSLFQEGLQSSLASLVASAPLTTAALLSNNNNNGGIGLVTQSSTEENSLSSIPSTPTTELENDPALLMPAPEEPPYFLEKWPGKCCILCNLAERSQMGQGEMLRIQAKAEFDNSLSNDDKNNLSTDSAGDISPKGGANSSVLSGNRRQKGLNKCK
jgi:histone-lysine N-methyltransferase MLL3